MYSLKNYIDRGSVFVNNQLRPSKKKLSTLMFYATDICDSGCKHCLIWAKRPTVSLPFDKIMEVMKSDCVSKDTNVGLEGGEFLLHPDAEKIMKWFYENHPNFDLLSNCLKPDALIEIVKKYPPKRLYISFDGTKESYLYMRGKDGHDSVVKVIETLKDVVPISIMFTLSPYNDFADMEYVAGVCKKNGVDMRVGVYNNIAFFDTVDKAHEADIGDKKDASLLKFQDVKVLKEEGVIDKIKMEKEKEKENLSDAKHEVKNHNKDFKKNIPKIIKEFAENYDFLMLYDEWRQKKLKLKCYSILDSIVVHPDGSVPICQNLDVKLGNIYNNTLDEIINSKSTQSIQNDHVNNCNQCWLNFHRKYDIVLYRNFEKYFGKWATSKVFGYYQWEEDKKGTYKSYMDKIEKTY